MRFQYRYDSLGNVTSERMARSDTGQALPTPNEGRLGDGQYESWGDWNEDGTSERIDSTMRYLTAGQVLFAGGRKR